VENYIHENDKFWEREIHAAELLDPEPSFSGVKIFSDKLKEYIFPGYDLISDEVLQARDRKSHFMIHKLMVSFLIREKFRRNWMAQAMSLFIRQETTPIAVISEKSLSY
jgi:hypothetical protein